MMEIYNERVQDLLIPVGKRPVGGNKIREHKTLGIYIEGMSKHVVDSADLMM
jgi:kinesin family member 13